MAIQAGTYKLGPHNASLHVETGRNGAAAKAGHDLIIDVKSWEATLEVGDDSSLQLSADPTSLHVREGKGGMQALKEDDKEDIRKTIDKDVLKKKTITFRSTSVEPAGESLKVSGDLEMGGKSNPVSLDLDESGGTLSGRAAVKQSDWGMKPYSALFGALKVNDEVKVVFQGTPS
ncbi:MAG TPA: YceI family protein [Solirubrobacteraceae bacterium]|nr:YceI family protein [Solirubrobacteraceae bacterium]